MVRLGFWVLGRKTAEVKGCFHHILPRVRAVNTLVTVDVDLGHLAEVALSGFSTVVTLPGLPYCTVQSEVTTRPTRGEWGLCSASSGMTCLQDSLGAEHVVMGGEHTTQHTGDAL